MTWVTRFRSTPTSPRPSHRGSPRTTTSTTCSCCRSPGEAVVHPRAGVRITVAQPAVERPKHSRCRSGHPGTGHRHGAASRRCVVLAARLPPLRQGTRRGLGAPDRRNSARSPATRWSRRLPLPLRTCRCAPRFRSESTYPTPSRCRPDLEATVSALQAWLDDARTDEASHAFGAVPGEPAGRRRSRRSHRQPRWALDVRPSLHLRDHLRVAIDAVGDDLRLSFADRNLTLPSSTRPALDAVLSGAVLAAGSLPGLDEADSLVLARRLLREASSSSPPAPPAADGYRES